MILLVGETAAKYLDAASLEARIYELLDVARRLRLDEEFDGGIEAVALLRVLARGAILQEGDDPDSRNRWVDRWDIHGAGIRVKVYPTIAWGMASSDIGQEGPIA